MKKPVNFELAKLLKEKGYDELCGEHYSYGNGDKEKPQTGQTYIGGFVDKMGNLRKYRNSELSKWELPYGEFSAPTIADVVMWLYEKHKIYIHISPHGDYETSLKDCKWWFSIYKDKIYNLQGGSKVTEGIEEFNSITEVYEAAIEYVLNNLI